MERTWIFGDAKILQVLRIAIIVATCISALAGAVIGVVFHVPLLLIASLVFAAIDVFFILKIEFLFGITIIDATLHINKRVYLLTDIRSISINASSLIVRTLKGKTFFMITPSATQLKNNMDAFVQLRNILLESCNAEVTIYSLTEGE